MSRQATRFDARSRKRQKLDQLGFICQTRRSRIRHIVDHIHRYGCRKEDMKTKEGHSAAALCCVCTACRDIQEVGRAQDSHIQELLLLMQGVAHSDLGTPLTLCRHPIIEIYPRHMAPYRREPVVST